ncbi:MAG: hypothetical protein C4K49_00360 [Candidatus Thorarchaeota archaeon]|nr:MAG: hypothetical protein C4K49_00360 [Candidatus Thorarchaeota archaeon]
MEVTEMTDQLQKPREAYVLSIASGIITILGSMLWIVLMTMGWTGGWFEWMDGFMHGAEGHMYFWGFEGFSYLIGFSGFLLGIGIILAAVMLDRRPNEHATWGLVIIILSAASMMASMGIGLLLGIVGGIIAVLWQPPTRPTVGTSQQA